MYIMTFWITLFASIGRWLNILPCEHGVGFWEKYIKLQYVYYDHGNTKEPFLNLLRWLLIINPRLKLAFFVICVHFVLL